MTSNSKLDWPAQIPSPDFAARTVTAILRDRQERREAGNIARRPSSQDRARGRWLLIAAAAAVTMAGGALAWTALPQAAKLPTAGSAEARPRPVEDVKRAVPTTASPPREMPPKPPSPPAVAPLRRKETPATPSSAASVPGRRIIVPRCNCQEAICDCLEAH